MARLLNVHPGDVLREDFLGPDRGWGSAYRLARLTGLSPTAIGEICTGKRAVTARTALRLGEALGTSARFWMNLQVAFDLEAAAAEGGG